MVPWAAREWRRLRGNGTGGRVDRRLPKTKVNEPSHVSRLKPAPRVIPKHRHPIVQADISNSAIQTMRRLVDAGFEAYLVGGCVRDMLLGLPPKDFDVVTEAHPRQVKDLFQRQGRLIGRRFQLVHVHFGREVVEVSTFRASHEHDTLGHQSTRAGRIVRDNVFGDINEDVWRRDFTVNALFYDFKNGSLLDYTSGMEDVRSRRLRLIGVPAQRYREDPVRMLRALRFAAKLEFDIEPEAASLLPAMGGLLAEVPGARLFEEFQKLFLHGYARTSLDLLLQHGMLHRLLPGIGPCLDQDAANAGRVQRMLRSLLEETDRRHAEGTRNSPTLLLAGLLWAPLEAALRSHGTDASQGQGLTPEAMREAGDRVLKEANLVMQVPRRFTDRVRVIWQLQAHMQDARRKNVMRFSTHTLLRPAYHLMNHRYLAGESELQTLLQSWEPYMQKAPAYRDLERTPRRSRRWRGRRQRP